MVEEINPTYYAAGTYILEYTLKGQGFMALPDDAVAVPMTSNDEPLQYRDATSRRVLMTISARSGSEVTFTAGISTDHGIGSIGAILSADRSLVYWMNNTRPLP